MHYYVKRLTQAIVTVVAVVSLTFFLIRFMPGGPMDYVRAQLISRNPNMSPQELESLIDVYINMQPDTPLWQQYVDYMGSILTGDLGNPLTIDRSVNEIIANALPWTIFLMGTALIVQYILGLLLGAFMAYYEGTRFDAGMSALSTVLYSVPYYLVALLLLILFAYQYPFFPTGGKMDPSTVAGFNLPFVVGVFKHAALPILSLVITGFGVVALRMRSNSISALESDYVRVARLRALSGPRIAYRYVARNAMLPLYTDFLIGLGVVFGGSVILEEIFKYTGIGYYMLQGVYSRDYPLMMGTFIVLTLAVVLGVLLADLTYGLVDPRAGGGDRESY
ncbi:ABC transporter permease [Halovenus marina]|uniref:ABC transporter permease n=1 Tax=Halovenus marina TaxID=3396621 RepID=UPI003F55869D